MAWAGGLALLPATAEAAEMLLFERPGCPWCRAWDAAIGPIYPRSEVGRRAPLRRIDLAADLPPGLTLKRPIRYTPTFVLVEDGHEVGRIEGYPGEDFFWGRAERLLGLSPAAP
ncbi:thioredoxin family protein [Methylobacterium sp. Leaf123]|uniref:thioredoxin family protein n=1 Tax=Methylobacterium sp. Leaf123 TaxID=1736264 RepID=UPI00191043DA|nr:thioredoxin family protein [Methylobacterium sp. Leaf123]